MVQFSGSITLPQSESGTQLGNSTANSLATLLEAGISPIDIQRVEVLIGADAAIYGSRSSGGVVLIYTRSGSEIRFVNRKEGELLLQGFEPIDDFNDYRKNLPPSVKKNSNLLYWNPSLELDKTEQTTIKVNGENLMDSNFRMVITLSSPTGTIIEKNIVFN